MRKRKNEGKVEKIEHTLIEEKLKGKNVPLLILDQRWLNLFQAHEKTKRIKQLESDLLALVKEQGKLNQDIKDLEKLKKQLLDKIVENMSAAQHNKFVEKKQEKSQELITQIKEKIQTAEERLLELPEEIRKTNEVLLIEGMQICYDRITKNETVIKEEEEWILNARNVLKDHILVKQDLEIKNQQMYAYMHDMLAREIIEIFDQEQDKIKQEEEQGADKDK